MLDWPLSAGCVHYDCGSCTGNGCECSCHVFPVNDDGELLTLEPYEDDPDPLRGIVYGRLFSLPLWGVLALLGWAIWKVAK